jgi:hypothetical protein
LNTDILEPVLNQKGEPCWLISELKKLVNVSTNKTIIEVIKENKPIEDESTYKLLPEGLWECQKCCNKFQSISKPEICPEDKGGCNRKSSFEQVTKIITNNIEHLWKLPKWKEYPKLDMYEVYNNLYKLAKEALIFPEEILYKIFVLWIIATYNINAWESVGWLQFVGLHDSGKTRALDFLSEVGYRLVHAGSGVTFPAIVRASHYHGAGVLLDQAEEKLTRKTESGREMLAFVKPSYRRRSKYVCAKKDEEEDVIARNNFGFKAFASERGLDRALNSRCITFQMQRDYPEVAKLSYIQSDLDEIQTQLLNYKHQFNKPEPLDNDFKLKGRIREIFEPIISTGKHIGLDVSDVLIFAQEMEKEKEEELIGTDEWEILNVIKGNEENERLFDAPEEISFKDICFGIGWEYDGKKAQKLGYIFNKKLLLKTKRKSHGTVLLLNDPKNNRRLKHLYKRYKV